MVTWRGVSRRTAVLQGWDREEGALVGLGLAGFTLGGAHSVSSL